MSYLISWFENILDRQYKLSAAQWDTWFWGEETSYYRFLWLKNNTVFFGLRDHVCQIFFQFLNFSSWTLYFYANELSVRRSWWSKNSISTSILINLILSSFERFRCFYLYNCSNISVSYSSSEMHIAYTVQKYSRRYSVKYLSSDLITIMCLLNF